MIMIYGTNNGTENARLKPPLFFIGVGVGRVCWWLKLAKFKMPKCACGFDVLNICVPMRNRLPCYGFGLKIPA